MRKLSRGSVAFWFVPFSYGVPLRAGGTSAAQREGERAVGRAWLRAPETKQTSKQTKHLNEAAPPYQLTPAQHASNNQCSRTQTYPASAERPRCVRTPQHTCTQAPRRTWAADRPAKYHAVPQLDSEWRKLQSESAPAATPADDVDVQRVRAAVSLSLRSSRRCCTTGASGTRPPLQAKELAEAWLRSQART